MEHAEFMHLQHPITDFCREANLIKVKHLDSIDGVKEYYNKYLEWCRECDLKKPNTFNQFIYHLHQLHFIVYGGMFVKYWKETGLPQSEFVT